MLISTSKTANNVREIYKHSGRGHLWDSQMSQYCNCCQAFKSNALLQLEGEWRGDEGQSGLVGSTLVPYADAFGLQRFRENELIHGRWAMLACLGVCKCLLLEPWTANSM